MKKVFYFMLVVVLASSCATGYYAPHNINQFGTQTQVILSEANFRIVRHLEVVIDINNSNLKRADVEKSAYAELVRRANLTGSQALINVVIEEVRRDKLYVFLTLFSGVRASKITQHVAARGTIIEFLDKNGNPVQSEAYKGSAPVTSQTTNTTTQSTDASYQGSAPRSGQTIEANAEAQQGQAISVTEADKCYIAWLVKTGHIKQGRVKELKQRFDFDELKVFSEKYSEEELHRMSKGHDKKLVRFAL
jgi:hypothetical protein